MTCRYSRGEVSALTCRAKGCKEAPCRAAGAKWERERRAKRASGTWDGLVDVAASRAHLDALMGSGMPLKHIAKLTGMSLSHLSFIRCRRVSKVTSLTQQTILSVRLKPTRHGTVDATGTRRRLQALARNGWWQNEIASRSGISRGLVSSIQNGQERVELHVQTAVSAIYDQLWCALPPAETTTQRHSQAVVATLATRRGWVPPLAWDDDEIDNPKARPHVGRPHANRGVIVDEVAVERLKQGQKVPVNKVEQRTAIAQLAAARVPSAEIADRLGMGLSSAIRTRNRITAAERQTA